MRASRLPGDTVTITVKEYEALLREGEAGRATAPNYRAISLSRIARDPELASFVMKQAETMVAREIESAGVDAFGRSRVPSRSAIYRFVREVHKAGFR
jgi:hypothetical protein